MNRQQKRKLNRESEKNTKNYGFSDKERNEIDNCVRKIRQGLTCMCSIKPLTTPAPIKYDNFISGSELDWRWILYTQLTAELIYILKKG